MTPAHPAAATPPESAARLIGRFYFGTNIGAGLASALIVAFLPTGLSALQRLALAGSIGLFTLLCLVATHLSARPRFPMHAALAAAAMAAMLLAGGVACLLGEGLRSAPLAFCGLVICVVGAITDVRHAIFLCAFALVGLSGLALAETEGLIDASAGATPLRGVWAFQSLVVVCGAIGGGLIAQVLNHYLRAAAEREQRFRGLLKIATDWYWEQDRHLQFTSLAEAGADVPGPVRPGQKDRPPWRLVDMGLTHEQLDAHRADLEAHRPFTGLLARRRDATARWRTLSLSGEPKFDADGAFSGYWGVARDVTDELAAQHAMAASETRYRELFTRSPSPLFLHRHGTVFDANEAAARLFGYANAAAMNGLAIVDLFVSGPTLEHVIERLGQLDAMALGEGLPVADFQLRAADGRPLSVQATAVRVDTSSGPANLSIFFDITARKAVEGALRRSEAMLSHLFATSPDCIALAEFETGRFAMVNPAFCRVTGFGADEVVGRTGAELGLWQAPAEATQLLARVAHEGTVLDVPALFVAKSGVRVSMLLAAGRFAMDRREYLVVNARDVTASERTRLQHAAILERASIGIAFTRSRLFVQANPFFEQMFGYEPGGLDGQPGAVVWPSDDAYEAVRALAGPLLSIGQPFESERLVRRRDGSEFWCRMLAQAVDRSEPSRGGTIWIAEDVTERRRLDAALAAARDAAEAASRAKSAFLANTSHEIRTPLNGLLGLARLAMQPELPEPRRQQYLAQILDSAQGLAGIMSDILDVSKIEAGKFALDDSPFDLRTTLAAVHHAYEELAEVKGLTLQLVVDAALPATLRGDRVRVRQILSNFITNALKFTERGGVRIEASRSAGGALRLAVSDTGPGVPQEMQARLFQPFSQGDSSTTRRFGGTGLGLSICRELAQLMGGHVGVTSRIGHGSTFWAELPLPDGTPAHPLPSTEAADLAALRGARVLVAEDNPVNMMIAAAMLEQWEVQVEQAVDGRCALDAVLAAARHGRPFDAVLMDVQMPVMSGHEATRELRRHYSPSELPIVALTAAALVSERDEAYRAGMDDFLTKPFEVAELRHALARLLQRRAPV